ncbi:hypothetical protein MAR_036787, partial [Mya arenaria]
QTQQTERENWSQEKEVWSRRNRLRPHSTVLLPPGSRCHGGAAFIISNHSPYSSHLHANKSEAHMTGRSALTFACLAEFLCLGSVVSMLPRAHLQVQDARETELGCYILQQDVVESRRCTGDVQERISRCSPCA